MSGYEVAAPVTQGVFTDAQLQSPPPCGDDVAVFVVHGMGQQSKFDTLAQVADQLGLTLDGVKSKRARNVSIGGERLTRMEMKFNKRKVHVYEAYWAPITEGQVTLRDVMGFLWSSGLNGLKNCVKPFHRWIFDEYPSFGRHFGTVLSLGIALAVAGALVFVNSLIALFEVIKATNAEPAWMTPALIGDLTTTALMLCLTMLSLVLMLLVCASSQKKACAVKSTKAPFISNLVFTYFVLTCFGVIGSAGAMMVMTHFHRGGMPSSAPIVAATVTVTTSLLLAAGALVALVSTAAVAWRGRRHRIRHVIGNLLTAGACGAAAYGVLCLAAAQATTPNSVFDGMQGVFPVYALAIAVVARWVAIWVLLAYISRQVRKFLVQYLGDVAVYATPSSLDRFNDMRERIKDCVFKVADAIYRARANDAAGAPTGKLQYGHILVIGHSLGSVAAYDCLNRVLNADAYTGGHLSARARTAQLITFGSPLNKFAFLFASNATQQTKGRAALAATVQPLVADPATQSIPWTNVYSDLDIISGPVSFYEIPGSGRVHNEQDPRAVVPVAAHTEYWDNPCIWQHAKFAIETHAAPVVHKKAVAAEGPHLAIKAAGKGAKIILPKGTTTVDLDWQ